MILACPVVLDFISQKARGRDYPKRKKKNHDKSSCLVLLKKIRFDLIHTCWLLFPKKSFRTGSKRLISNPKDEFSTSFARLQSHLRHLLYLVHGWGWSCVRKFWGYFTLTTRLLTSRAGRSCNSLSHAQRNNQGNFFFFFKLWTTWGIFLFGFDSL